MARSLSGQTGRSCPHKALAGAMHMLERKWSCTSLLLSRNNGVVRSQIGSQGLLLLFAVII